MVTLAARVAARLREALSDPEHYARRHKSAEGQQEFRWITIGAHDHEGGTHVQIKSSTGEIVAGPDALTGKKVGELGKPEAKKAEPKSNEKPARKSGYFKGDRIEYTGKTVDGFHEFEYMEGHKKGETGVTATAPDGSRPRDGKFQEEWKQQQEEFGRLHKKPDAEPKEGSKTTTAKGGHAAILDHLKSGKHTSLSDLRDAIGDSPTLEDDLRALADDDRISMHKPRTGEPGLWMTPEQVKRQDERQRHVEFKRGMVDEKSETLEGHKQKWDEWHDSDQMQAIHSELSKTDPEYRHFEKAMEDAAQSSDYDGDDTDPALKPYLSKLEILAANAARKKGIYPPEKTVKARMSAVKSSGELQPFNEDKPTESKEPADSVPKEPQPSQDDRDEGGPLPVASDNPRQTAGELFNKEYDSEYDFARKSSIPNFGDDVKHSARHKRNSWRGLEQAERDGTAAEFVTRDSLMKLEPHDLIERADKNPMTSLAMYYALRTIPAKPGYNGRGDDAYSRADFHEMYGRLKDFASQQAAKQPDPAKAVEDFRTEVQSIIREFRGRPRREGEIYNWTAESMISMQSPLSSWKRRGNAVMAKLEEFARADKKKYGEHPDVYVDIKAAGDRIEKIKEHVKDIIEGVSLPATFGDSKKSNRFNPSDLYVKIASRKGGKDVATLTSSGVKAASSITDHFKMKGLQWGNSVTDDERRHHATKLVEAFTDLADILGLRPEDASLDGKLSMAIGARGKSNALAHYEPGLKVINMTRVKGVGSLAHEWGHAFDDLAGDGKRFLSEAFHGSDLVKATNTVMDAMHSSGYAERLREQVSEMSAKERSYWNSRKEKFARCFERYIQRKLEKSDRANTYLSGIETKSYKQGGLWPVDAEVDKMSDAFDGLFSAYRKAKYGSEEPQRFSREELAEFYAKQLGFNWDEQKHPRGEGGLFAKKGDGGPKSEPRTFNDPIGTRYEPDHAKEMVGQIRDGDAGSKNRGEYSQRLDTGPLVMSEIPTNFFDQYPDEEDGNATNFYKSGASPDRVGKYKTTDAKNLPPIYVHTNSKGRHILSDGAHRLTAAIARGDKTIRALVSPELHEQLSKKPAEPAGKAEKPEPSAAHKAVASRFGIPPEAVQDIASTDVKELRRRDEYTPPNYAGDGPVTDFEDHPLGTTRIMSFGDPNEAYVDFMHEFDPKELTPTEHEDGIKQRDKSYPKYVEWAKAGHKPPPISAAVSEKTGKYLSMNRRRVLAAQDAGVKSIKGWLGVNNKETGNPLKYGDVMRALKEHEQKSSAQPESKPEPQSAAKAKPPGVAGMQQGLFGQDTSGQKSLFNVAKPTAKKPVAKEIAAKVAGRLGELLAGKATVSPADLTIPIQSESLPGQKSMFSMDSDQYQKRWITLGKDGQEHRTRIQIDDDGRITAGPAALKGDNIASLGDKSKSAERRAKAAHAHADGKTGRDYSHRQATALAAQNRMQQYDAARSAGRLAGVAAKDVIKAMPEAYRFLKDQAELRERAKDRARKLTGMNAGTLSQIENSHRDYSSVPGFDEAAHAVAMEHPELGLDPDDTDTPAAVWELIREGKQDPPAMHSPEVAKLAAEWLKPSKRKAAPEPEDSVPFSRAGEPERYGAIWDEQKHPRGEGGRFVTIPASHTFGEMKAEIQNNDDGSATIVRHRDDGKRDGLVKMHGSQVNTFLDDLGGVVSSKSRTGSKSIDAVLDGNAKFIDRGNDGLAFDTGDGNVVKVSSDVGYHWNHGIRPVGEGASRMKKAADLNNELIAKGVPGLLKQEVTEHDGRTFLTMKKLQLPEKFTEEQLHQITNSVKAIHEQGLAIGDQIQAGLDSSGNAYIYDTGTLSPAGKYSVEDDNDNLKSLWSKSGVKFGGLDTEQSRFLHYDDKLQEAISLLKNPPPLPNTMQWQTYKDEVEEAWKHISDDTKEFMGDIHAATIRGIDEQLIRARERKEAAKRIT